MRWFVGCVALAIVGSGTAAARANPTPSFSGVRIEWTKPAPASAPDEDDSEPPPLSFAELRQLFPDLGYRDSPPFRWSLSLDSHAPFQWLGVGLNVEGFATSWLRLSATYAAGASLGDKDVEFSNYAEASAGVALFSTHTNVDEPLTTRPDPAHPNLVHALIPVYQAMLVEGGALSGLLTWQSCTDNCTDPDVTNLQFADHNRQLVLPFAGLRYIYYYDVASRHAALRRRALTEVYVHAIFSPLDPPPNGAYWERNTTSKVALGGRLGFDFLTHSHDGNDTGVARWGFALGVLPYPLLPFLELRLAFER